MCISSRLLTFPLSCHSASIFFRSKLGRDPKEVIVIKPKSVQVMCNLETRLRNALTWPSSPQTLLPGPVLSISTTNAAAFFLSSVVAMIPPLALPESAHLCPSGRVRSLKCSSLHPYLHHWGIFPSGERKHICICLTKQYLYFPSSANSFTWHLMLFQSLPLTTTEEKLLSTHEASS